HVTAVGRPRFGACRGNHETPERHAKKTAQAAGTHRSHGSSFLTLFFASFGYFLVVRLLHLRRLIVDHAADGGAGHGDLPGPPHTRAVLHLQPIGARLEGEADLRRRLAAAAITAGDMLRAVDLAVLVTDHDPAADHAILPRHLEERQR